MDTQAHDLLRWLMLVGTTALGAVVAGLTQRHWLGRLD
jgi:hypothetical protein